MQAPEFVPNPVNSLLRDALEGKISRRDMMAKGTAMGLSASILGLMSARVSAAEATPAGSPAASPAAETKMAGWSLTKPEWLTQDFSGKKITTVLGADGPGRPFDQACCDFFAKATGCEVTYVQGAESATDRLTYYTQTLNAGSADFDVFTVDVIWPGILQSHAVDLTDIANELKEGGATFFERILTNNTIGDVMVSLPTYTDAGCLYWRTDLLEKYKLEVPKTWDELTTAAKTIMDGEVAAGNKSFVGFTFQGAAYEGLTCDGLEWVYSNGGGTYIDADGKVTINNDNAKKALEMAKGWVGTIAPSAVTNYKEEDSRGVWQGGNAAFHRNWPYAYSISAADDSQLKGKFGMGLLPAGSEGNAATLGGWNMMVSKYSKEQDVAKAFAKYMNSPETQRARAIERSLNPTIEEVYKDADVIAANPYQENLYDVFKEGSIARPSSVSGDLYNDVSVAVFTAFNGILSGQQSDVNKTFEELAAKLEDIMQDA